MEFNVQCINGNDRNGHSCYIHKAGCKDILKQHETHWFLGTEIVNGTLQDAINAYLDDELKAMGYDADIIKVFPCARKEG